METFETKSRREEMFEAVEERASSIKQKLGNFGRRIKRMDLRGTIVGHPFTAVGIAAGVGAIVGLARPMPKRGPISGAMMAIVSAIGFRLVREAAMAQVGQYAMGLLSKDREQQAPGMQANVPQAGTTTY